MRCSQKKEDSVSVEQEGPNFSLMEPNLNSPPQARTPSVFGPGNRKDNYGSNTLKKMWSVIYLGKPRKVVALRNCK